jgi:uncharacterized glyoxalase superfamily protein PhnB
MGFYEAAFEGFQALPGASDMHGVVRYRDLTIMFIKQGGCSPALSPDSSGHNCPMSLYIYVDDVDAFYQRAVEAGAKGTSEPKDVFYGDRVASVVDPDGYSWVFATRSKDDSHTDEAHKQCFQKQHASDN